MRKPSPHLTDGIRRWALGRWLRADEVETVEPSGKGLVPLSVSRAPTSSLCSLPREDTVRRRSSPEPDHTGTLISDCQTQELWETKFHCQSRASQVVLLVESVCQCRRHKRRGFNPWVRKIPWRRKWQPAPVLLPGKLHGQRSLAGYRPRGAEPDTEPARRL